MSNLFWGKWLTICALTQWVTSQWDTEYTPPQKNTSSCPHPPWNCFPFYSFSPFDFSFLSFARAHQLDCELLVFMSALIPFSFCAEFPLIYVTLKQTHLRSLCSYVTVALSERKLLLPLSQVPLQWEGVNFHVCVNFVHWYRNQAKYCLQRDTQTTEEKKVTTSQWENTNNV